MSIDIDHLETLAKRRIMAGADDTLSLIARLREAESERDELAVENRKLKSRSGWLEGEREALLRHRMAVADTLGCEPHHKAVMEAISVLAAHVERGRVIMSKLCENDFNNRSADQQLFGWYTDAPTTSLARRDAERLQLGMLQGGVAAAALMAGQCEVTAREVLHAFGVTTGEDLRGCAEYDIARLIEHRVRVPGLHAAWQEARRKERRQAEQADTAGEGT